VIRGSLAAAGLSPIPIQALCGQVNLVAPAGTNQATATALFAAEVTLILSSSPGTGVILPTLTLGDAMQVSNHSANSITVYPPVGSTIGTGATNAGVSLASGKTGIFRCVTATGFSSLLSA
jgi:hypothetical protein